MPKVKWVILVFLACLLVYLSYDYTGPEVIELENGIAFGIACKKAKDLNIQSVDKDGTAWASRGLLIYSKKKNENQFRRKAHVPTGFSLFWLRNFGFVRWLTQRPECIEFVVAKNGDISALSAGYIWYYNHETKNFTASLKLPHYSIGNQGVLSNGLLQTESGTLFLGEYFKNETDTSVSIYSSSNHGKTWIIKNQFPAHQIRHIHAIQEDPYTKKLWLTTGDEGGNYIYWSTDEFSTLNPIGFGESYFTTQLLFTEENIYWGSDTESKTHSGIYRWSRKSGTLDKLISYPSIFFFSNQLKNGTQVFSTSLENLDFEKDRFIRLFIKSPQGKWTSLTTGEWKKNSIPGLFQRGKTRLPRENNQSDALYASFLKQKEFDDNELIIIQEKDLIEKVK